MFTAIIDSREDEKYFWPLKLSDGTKIPTEVSKLDTGDYSIKGLEHVICLERKSKDDILGCIGQSRERFEREIMRMLAFPTRALIIESTWVEFESGNFRQRLSINSVMGSLMGWVAKGIPIIMAGDHRRAAKYASQIMTITYNRRLRENKSLLGGANGRKGTGNRSKGVGKSNEDKKA